jgi:hypothetical protein
MQDGLEEGRVQRSGQNDQDLSLAAGFIRLFPCFAWTVECDGGDSM